MSGLSSSIILEETEGRPSRWGEATETVLGAQRTYAEQQGARLEAAEREAEEEAGHWAFGAESDEDKEKARSQLEGMGIETTAENMQLLKYYNSSAKLFFEDLDLNSSDFNQRWDTFESRLNTMEKNNKKFTNALRNRLDIIIIHHCSECYHDGELDLDKLKDSLSKNLDDQGINQEMKSDILSLFNRVSIKSQEILLEFAKRKAAKAQAAADAEAEQAAAMEKEGARLEAAAREAAESYDKAKAKAEAATASYEKAKAEAAKTKAFRYKKIPLVPRWIFARLAFLTILAIIVSLATAFGGSSAGGNKTLYYDCNNCCTLVTSPATVLSSYYMNLDTCKQSCSITPSGTQCSWKESFIDLPLRENFAALAPGASSNAPQSTAEGQQSTAESNCPACDIYSQLGGFTGILAESIRARQKSDTSLVVTLIVVSCIVLPLILFVLYMFYRHRNN